MGPAVQHVQHRDRQRVRVGPADGTKERESEFVRDRLGIGHRNGQERVGAQPSLVRCPVQIDQGEIDSALVERVQSLQGVGDVPVDVGHRLQDALAAEATAAVSQFDGLVYPR